MSIQSEVEWAIQACTNRINTLTSEMSQITEGSPEYNEKLRQRRIFYRSHHILERYLFEVNNPDFTPDVTVRRRAEIDEIINHVAPQVESNLASRLSEVFGSDRWIIFNNRVKFFFILKIISDRRDFYLDDSVVAP